MWDLENDHVSLKVDLRNVSNETVKLDDDSLSFMAVGHGVRGENLYNFEIEFYLPIDAKASQYRINERAVEFRLQKDVVGEVWPRLTYKPIKHPWLKIDFDKFAIEEDSDEKLDFEASENDLIKQFGNSGMKKVETKSLINFNYLFLYNLFQFVGFSYICGSMQYHYYKYGEDSKLNVFESVGSQLLCLQLIAFLEIFHSIFGIVKTKIIPTLFQVLGRNFILLIVVFDSYLQHVPALWLLILVWSFAEIMRYPYYMLQTIDREARFITWIRYSAWIILYPLGIFLEGTIILAGIPMYEMSKRFTFVLPNSYNFSFYFPWFLQIYLFSMVPAGYFQMNYMYKQRKKKLANFSLHSKKD